MNGSHPKSSHPPKPFGIRHIVRRATYPGPETGVLGYLVEHMFDKVKPVPPWKGCAMRGLSALEQRSEQLRSWTFLGLLADDVALATARYPEDSEAQRRAVAALLDLVAPPAEPASSSPVIPRRRSMGDPDAILREAAAIARGGRPTLSTPGTPELDFISDPLKNMLHRDASDEDLRTVRAFADILGRVTLSMTEQLASEKAPTEWTTRASLFFAE